MKVLSLLLFLVTLSLGAGPLADRIRERVKDGGATTALAGEERTWEVKGTKRTGVVVKPSKKSPDTGCPVVFVFHGHGGWGRQIQRSWRVEDKWPEAVVVYLDGLPSKGMTDPDGKKNGWETQRNSDFDRDLSFFDVVWTGLQKEFTVDRSKVFVGGHSNGGSMTYLLWARRGDLFAAAAPSASVPAFMTPELKPKPCLVLAGKGDTVVPFPWQQRGHASLMKLNGADAEGKPWLEGGDKAVWYTGKAAPLVTWIHDGGHEMSPGSVDAIITFFKKVADKQS